jgi:PKD repeat protein
MFGAAVDVGGPGSQTPAAVSGLEATAGRPLDVNRVYAWWNTPEPDSQVVWDLANGITPILSIDPNLTDGTALSWAQIAAGAYDADITAMARALASLGQPLLVSFDHEPELDLTNGTAATFVPAFRHFVTLFRDAGATDVSFVAIFMHDTYYDGTLSQWYPGDAYVDWVGADAYNTDGCHGGPQDWDELSTMLAAFNSFALAHHKPAVVAEFASAEDPSMPGRKAEWLRDAAETLEGWPQIKAVSYFDGEGNYPQCEWPLTSSASALAAWVSMGAQSFFNPRPRAVMTASPSSGPVPLEVTFDTTGTESVNHPLSGWKIDFGDGTELTAGSGAPPMKIVHTYPAGTYTAVLTVDDNSGLTDMASVPIRGYPLATVVSGTGFPTSVSTATLNGTVDPGGLDTTFTFDWGTTPALSEESAPVDVGSESRSYFETFKVTGLEPATTYYWRMSASNAAGVSLGATKTFRTKGASPGVSRLAASVVTSDRVQLTG